MLKSFRKSLVYAKESYEATPALHGIISKEAHNFINLTNAHTVDGLQKEWCSQQKENFGLWEKYGPVQGDCVGLCYNKAVIGVGAGQSFNKNKQVLRSIAQRDGIRDWKDRAFVICASNHQYKPLLKMGIIPDFVFLVDASKATYNQLCVDIPHSGQNTTLIVPTHVNPKVVNEWEKQGRAMRFYVTSAEPVKAAFNRKTGLDPEKYKVTNGGNILNTIWMLTGQVMRSKVFIALGNDLSFEIKDTQTEQETGYYADGDYSSNAKDTGTGRDEAKCEKKWLSFKLSPRKVLTAKANERPEEISGGDVVGTSHTLFVYKTWIEEAVLIGAAQEKSSFHYYNCSEGGILGVLAKSTDDAEMKKDENWFMLDEKCNRYHTTTLEFAIKQFLQARGALQWTAERENISGAPSVADLVRQQQVGFAQGASPMRPN